MTLICSCGRPAYWFGEYQIHGFKPLFNVNGFNEVAAFFKDQSAFDYWVASNSQQSMQYEMKLGNVNLSVRYPYQTLDIPTMKSHVSIYDRSIRYGVFDKMSASNSYDRQYLVATHLNDSDFLIEDFVTSSASEKKDNTPCVLSGDVHSVAALKIGNEINMTDEWSGRLRDEFDWKKEQDFSIYVALVGDETARDDYATMHLDANHCSMAMELAGGPVLHSTMMYAGEFDVIENSDYQAGLPKDKSDNYTSLYMLIANADVPEPLTDKDLIHFRSMAIRDIERKGLGSILDLSDTSQPKLKRYLYVMKFDLSYTAPNGKTVQGLRPFGDVIDELTGAITPMGLSVSILRQTTLSTGYTCPDFDLFLPSSDRYDSPSMPWAKHIQDSEATNLSACHYWNSLDDVEKSAWLKKWIENDKTSTQAPSVELLQV